MLPVEPLRDREKPARQPDDDIRMRVSVVRLHHQHLHAGEDKKTSEDVDDPGELLNHGGPDGDHDPAHEEGADNAPEQHPVLVDRWNRQEPEDHADDKDVVHGQRFLDQIAREVLHGRGGAIVVDRAQPFDRTRGGPHQVGGQTEAQPVVLVSEVDEDAERESQEYPERRPSERFPDRDNVGLPVEDTEVKSQEEEY